AADLGEPQTLRPEEPLHVGGAHADPQRGVHPGAHLAQLLVVARGVDPVGRDVLRGDPPGAHRLQDVRVVVRHELQLGGAVDRHRVVETLVALHELLDRARLDPLPAEPGERLLPPGAVLLAAGRARVRRASLSAGVSRHSQAGGTDVAGVLEFLGPCAVTSLGATLVASRHATQTLSWIRPTSSISTPVSTTIGARWEGVRNP